jgi:hypothetical protein
MALALGALFRKTYDKSFLDILRSRIQRRPFPNAT